MAQKAEYRNAKRSRRAIRSAFIDLLRTHDIDTITVTAIVKLADINRSTFYAHYSDVHGVIEEIEDETIAKLMTVLDDIQSAEFLRDPTPMIARIGHQLEAERDYYRVLIQASGAAGFLDKLQTVFAERMIGDAAIPAAIRERRSYVLRVNYFAGGIVNLYKLWFAGSLDCSMDDISKEVGRMVSLASVDMLGAHRNDASIGPGAIPTAISDDFGFSVS
ncbi:TetR-like C-terminal domain-containing protein [Bifidobacterium sp. SO4]|uniref:TetR/AcrR family transcriptional regulator n=1 Tax=Bifidobacterium sp. SO4 TaxID=2809030 RepID=UPI001BDD9B05|nr:TetR-like C-terminal domain-containing protein [Bifidobacterium sp. SO4]MBT1169624.1 TetR/AcrR family transcriptional regulator [Bifidobacterium sp. SO4]